MSTARAILLEVKRRLGDTTTPYPDETDALAFLNKAIQGIYNYGVLLRSERLKKISEVTTSATGSTTISDGIAFISKIYNESTGREVFPLTSSEDYLKTQRLNTANNPPYYKVSEDTIQLFPSTTEAQTILVEYFPRVSKVTRDDDLPFSPELDSIIEAWVIALISNKDTGLNDMAFAVSQQYGNTLSRYFRDGQFNRLITGRGVW